MKGKLQYYKKCEETVNSIEGWAITPIQDKYTSTCYGLTEDSLAKIADHDKSKVYEIEYKLLTNCEVDEDGYHVRHGVIAKIEML